MDVRRDPIQVMSAIDMRLQTLAEFPGSVAPEDIAGIETEVHAAMKQLRWRPFELRPAALDREGLVSVGVFFRAEREGQRTGWSRSSTL